MVNRLYTGLAALALNGAATSAASQAYVDCGHFQSTQDRQWCYAQQAQMYQQQSQSWDAIGNDWQDVHDFGGAFIGATGEASGMPWITYYGGAAWDVPALVNNWYQGW